MKKNIWKKLTVMALAICLSVSCLCIAPAEAAEDTLTASMEYLVDECGSRLYGTPNEEKAAAFVKAQFESFGYSDVQWVQPTLNSVSYVGKLSFSDGTQDIYGNCYPNSDAFAKVTAKLVDLGTDTAYAVPTGITGDIIGAVKFAEAPTLDAVNAIAAKIAADYTDVTLKGLLLCKDNSITVVRTKTLDNSTIPCVVTTEYFFDAALAKADALTGMERYERTMTNAVIATKEAATDDPDAIIIVTAHLDSVMAAPGASDNATGVSTLIELAKKFSTVDNGNIKLIFGAVGAEEGGGMLGSMYIINNLTAEEKAIAINLNMDMLGAIQPTGDGVPLNAVSMDIYCGKNSNAKPLTLNLPAYLVTNGAADVTWASGIENVRIFKYGSSDHQKFQEAGIDAASMIVVTDEDDDIESINHSSADTIENNYSYERHLMCTNLMANGIQTAIDKELSKKAEITFTKKNDNTITAALSNGAQLFKLYDKVVATLSVEGAEPVELTFTADALTAPVTVDPETCTITAIGYGSGVADNKDAQRSEELKNFSAALVAETTVKTAAPETGDTFNTTLYIGLLTLSAMAAAAVVCKAKKVEA